MFEIQNLSRYDPRRSRNGGSYAFYEKFEVEGGQAVNGHHSTSAEFDYCEFCGSFESNLRDHQERFCHEHEYLPSPMAKEAAHLIKEFGFLNAKPKFEAWAGEDITLVKKD